MADKRILPTWDYVLIEPVRERMSPGGIALPDNADLDVDKASRGKVVAVGPGRVNDDGQTVKSRIEKGYTVYYRTYAGVDIEEGQKYRLVRETDVIAIIVG